MGDATVPGYSERNTTGTGTRTIDDADGLEGAEGKIDIIMPDKTNKLPILVSY